MEEPNEASGGWDVQAMVTPVLHSADMIIVRYIDDEVIGKMCMAVHTCGFVYTIRPAYVVECKSNRTGLFLHTT